MFAGEDFNPTHAVQAALAGAVLAFLAVAFWGSIATAGAAVWQWLTTTGLGLLKLGVGKALAFVRWVGRGIWATARAIALGITKTLTWFGQWWWSGFRAMGLRKFLRNSLRTTGVNTAAFNWNS